MLTRQKSNWVTSNSHPQAQCKVKLFCFPYAGGGSAVFYPWREALRSEIDLLRIQLPGREHRLREPLFTNLDALVEKLVNELWHEFSQQPVAFFGHSMGAVVAFEVVRELERQHDIVPVHLFVSGHRAPHLPNPDLPCSNLSDVDFIARVCAYEGIPDLILQNQELMEIFLPILKADFEILESYCYKDGLPLICPLTVFGGMTDPKVSKKDIDAWSVHTSSHFDQQILSGGHFFIHDSMPQVIEQINLALVDSC